MKHYFMVIKETMVVVEKIMEIKENVLIILTKEILYTTRSGTILRQNKMKTKVYKINLQRNMKLNVTCVV
jgi:hypothetical protein